MSGFEILGTVSALLVLIIFIANEYGKASSESFLYDLVNFLGGLGLFVYAYHLGSIPFMLTNGVWAFVSGIDVLKYMLGWGSLKKRR